MPLLVRLAGRTTTLRAHYSTRPFADAPYYSYRFGRSTSDGRGIEAEMLHHKLYLENPRPPIERFEVTHGYNLPTVNAVSGGDRWRWRFGVGLVVAHPEGRIAGHDISGAPTFLGGGYHIAGVTTQVAIGRHYALNRRQLTLTAAPEVKLTASWARISVGSTTLYVPEVAAHVLGGLGVQRCASRF